ncbi:MAG TPA: Crp/Fnr family transcriptional regulator [Planctomycetota bacterium]|nr:Crp/Fnr family transcriptional regulator [Planctomycetota bacterium]
MIQRHMLRDIDLFRDLPEAHMDKLAAAARPWTLIRGESVFRDGEGAERLYAVLSGVVDVGRVGRDGKFVRLARLERGEVFGALSPAGPRARGGTAVAAIAPETHLVSWDPAELHTLMTQDPAFGLAFMRNLVARLSGRLHSASEAVFTLLQAMAR